MYSCLLPRIYLFLNQFLIERVSTGLYPHPEYIQTLLWKLSGSDRCIQRETCASYDRCDVTRLCEFGIDAPTRRYLPLLEQAVSFRPHPVQLPALVIRVVQVSRGLAQLRA